MSVKKSRKDLKQITEHAVTEICQFIANIEEKAFSRASGTNCSKDLTFFLKKKRRKWREKKKITLLEMQWYVCHKI